MQWRPTKCSGMLSQGRLEWSGISNKDETTNPSPFPHKFSLTDAKAYLPPECTRWRGRDASWHGHYEDSGFQRVSGSFHTYGGGEGAFKATVGKLWAQYIGANPGQTCPWTNLVDETFFGVGELCSSICKINVGTLAVVVVSSAWHLCLGSIGSLQQLLVINHSNRGWDEKYTIQGSTSMLCSHVLHTHYHTYSDSQKSAWIVP